MGNEAACPWHFCLIDVPYEPSSILQLGLLERKEANAFVQWNKLELNPAPNNRFKDLTQS